MTISFKNTYRDRLAFFAYHLPRNRMMQVWVLASFLLFNYLTVLPVVRQTMGQGVSAAKVIAFVFVELVLACCVLAFWGFFTLLTFLASKSSKNKTFFCQKTVTLRDEGMTGESEYGRSEIRWKMVQKLGRTKEHLFIYLSAEGAWVIPRRAFVSISEWDAFYDICKRSVNHV